MIIEFSKEIQWESANYLNKLFIFNDYFQLFFAHSNCYSFCVCLREYWIKAVDEST